MYILLHWTSCVTCKCILMIWLYNGQNNNSQLSVLYTGAMGKMYCMHYLGANQLLYRYILCTLPWQGSGEVALYATHSLRSADVLIVFYLLLSGLFASFPGNVHIESARVILCDCKLVTLLTLHNMCTGYGVVCWNYIVQLLSMRLYICMH